MIAGSYKSDRPINNTGIDKVHLKSNCVDGSIVIGVREPIFYSFALSSRLGKKFTKKLDSNFLKK